MAHLIHSACSQASNSPFSLIQCSVYFLIQLNIAAHGNVLKEGQRVGQLCIEANGVMVIFIGVSYILIIDIDQIVSKLSTGKLKCQLRFMNY